MKKITFLVSLLFIFSVNLNAQSWIEKLGNKAKEAAKRAVEHKVENKADEATNKAMDKTEDAIKKGTKKTDKPSQNSDENVATNTGENSKKSRNEKTQSTTHDATPYLQSYSKYDFIPGDKVLFFSDFSNASIGDFPAEWNTNGSGEVVTTNNYSGKWLKTIITSYQAIWTDDLLKLPENYTIEFDIIPIQGEEKGMAGWEFRLMEAINAKSWDGGAVQGKAGFAFGIEYYGRPWYRAYDNQLDGDFWDIKGNQEDKDFWEKENQKYHVAIWVQKTRIRVYHGEGKMFDLPRAIPDAATKFNRVRFDGGALMVTNLRIAEASPDMRSKLLTEGKLVSYGIYFDINKDIIKPESYGSLKMIADILQENPNVQIKIVGHTDSDGDDAKNLDLSKRRGTAVKNALVKNFNIEASRIESDGAGETQPVAKNDTPTNKALNRRVEFIKL